MGRAGWLCPREEAGVWRWTFCNGQRCGAGGGKEARGDVRGTFLEPLGQRERRQRQRKRWKGHNKTLLSVQDVSCYVLTTL